MNPWHDVPADFSNENEVNALIEISAGMRAKYELDKETGLLKLDRVLYSSVYYPANYGFVPQTLAEDDDPIDILVLSQVNLQPLSIVKARIIGVMLMTDQGDPDEKLIAVATGDTSVNHYHNMEDLPPMFGEEVRQFFQEYKKLENKPVTVDEFKGQAEALKLLKNSIDRYKEKYQ